MPPWESYYNSGPERVILGMIGHWASFLKLKKLVMPTGFGREESAVFE